MDKRFGAVHVEQWRQEGFVVVPGFFSPSEIAPVVADFDELYGASRPEHATAVNFKAAGQIGTMHAKQFVNFDALPYAGSAAINLISLHPALIDFSRALLGVPDVRCYQSHTWAKFTGLADYDQAFHCDFGNHTLTVPADEARWRSVDFVVYLTDVTDDLGALHYVPKPDADRILGTGEVIAQPEHQAALMSAQRSAAGPSGTLLVHGIDTFHRGTNLTRPGGHRYTMTVGYKAAENDMIGFHVWQSSPQRPWQHILDHASPAQLEVLGIPLPGHEFWTERTLRLTQMRWPDWDLSPYVQAMGKDS